MLIERLVSARIEVGVEIDEEASWMLCQIPGVVSNAGCPVVTIESSTYKELENLERRVLGILGATLEQLEVA